MSKSDERYLQFPLSFMRTAFSDVKDTMNRILHVGLYYFAQRTEFDKESVSRQIVYDLYHENLSPTIRAEIDALQSEVIGCDEDYKGFVCGTFDPIDEVEALKAVFATKDHFYTQAVEHYQMHQAIRFMGIEGSTAHIVKVGKKLAQESIPGEPMPMINVNMLFDFRDNDKSEQDIAQLSAYIAIKSILGTKEYVRTNKEHIVCRMFGYSSKNQIPDNIPEHQKELFRKYSTRYHIDKTLTKLRENWGIDIYAKHIRGLYISAGKISLNELALKAERNKQKRKFEAMKMKTNEAQKYALEQLNRECER